LKQWFLGKGEIEHQLKNCRTSSHPFRCLFLVLLLHTGARGGEMGALKWRDINFNKRRWAVPLRKNRLSMEIALSKKALVVLEQIKLRSGALDMPRTEDSWVFANSRTQLSYTSMHITFLKPEKVWG
jgi:integrase